MKLIGDALRSVVVVLSLGNQWSFRTDEVILLTSGILMIGMSL
jgi:hypothetical protein